MTTKAATVASAIGGPAIAFPRALRRGTLLHRLGRFMAAVELDGEAVLAFVANSGRLPGLMEAGTAVWLAAVEPRPAGTGRAGKRGHGGERRTTFDLNLVEQPASLVCVDTRMPNALMREALRAGALPDFACYPGVRPESVYGSSRFDFRLSAGGPASAEVERAEAAPGGPLAGQSACLPDCLVEVKSVTLCLDGAGLFPDAPTIRGQRHVTELAEAVRAGHRAAVAFVVQRMDVDHVAPYDALDPAFGAALRAATEAGVEVHAYGCDITTEGIGIRRELPVRL